MEASRASLARLQSTVTALPYTNYKTEVLDALLSVSTQTWAVANKGKMFNETICWSTAIKSEIKCPDLLSQTYQTSFRQSCHLERGSGRHAGDNVINKVKDNGQCFMNEAVSLPDGVTGPRC